MVVSKSTLRQDIFTALRTLIVAHKPTYTYNGSTITYTLVSAFNDDNPVLPCIVLNESMVNVKPITLDAQTQDYAVEISLDFYAKQLHGKKAIDAGQDSLLATFITNISTFISTDNLEPQEDFWTDEASSDFKSNEQIINTATSNVKFKVN